MVARHGLEFGPQCGALGQRGALNACRTGWTGWGAPSLLLSKGPGSAAAWCLNPGVLDQG